MKTKILKITYLVSALILLSACKKEKVTSSTFDMSVSKIQSSAVWIDVIPENNDFYYRVGIVSVADYAKIESDAKFIANDYAEMLDLYDTICELLGRDNVKSFEETMFEVGAIDGQRQMLQPETDYYLYAYRLDRKKKPIKTLIKLPFKTVKKPVSDITFSLTANGSQLMVKPSNNDTYYWDHELKQNIDNNYFGSIYLCFSDIINTYYEYDFINSLLSQGNDSDDAAIYYPLSVGDTLQVACVGYAGEPSSEYQFFEVVYRGENSPAEVRSIHDEMYEMLDSTDYAQASARKNAIERCIAKQNRTHKKLNRYEKSH